MTDDEIEALAQERAPRSECAILALCREVRDAERERAAREAAKVCDDFAAAIEGSSYESRDAMKASAGTIRQAGSRILMHFGLAKDLHEAAAIRQGET